MISLPEGLFLGSDFVQEFLPAFEKLGSAGLGLGLVRRRDNRIVLLGDPLLGNLAAFAAYLEREHPEIEKDFIRHHQAIGRLGTAEEIAPFAVFMASEQAAFACGALVAVDGGTM